MYNPIDKKTGQILFRPVLISKNKQNIEDNKVKNQYFFLFIYLFIYFYLE